MKRPKRTKPLTARERAFLTSSPTTEERVQLRSRLFSYPSLQSELARTKARRSRPARQRVWDEEWEETKKLIRKKKAEYDKKAVGLPRNQWACNELDAKQRPIPQRSAAAVAGEWARAYKDPRFRNSINLLINKA